MTEQPVWITGVGLATSLGCNLPALEANLLSRAIGDRGRDLVLHDRLSQPDRGRVS